MQLVGAVAAIAALVPTSPGPASPPSTPTYIGLGYICGAEQRPRAQTPRRLVMAPGMGSGGFKVRAGTPEAQQWLDYGLKLYHAFYHDDAKAAFARAVDLDPTCALCAWGQALGLGPTRNYKISDEETATALAAARRAFTLARTPLERDLTAAIERRYHPEASPEARAEAFAEAMSALADRYPGEPELAALAGHALLAADRDAAAIAILKRALARDPNDTAAIHYYIHATDGGDRAADALPYAERLAGLAPNASHLVHMAAHTLVRVGRYQEVAVVNARALKVDADYAQSMAYQGPLGEPRYYAHNMMFGVFGALMAGDRDLALKYADHARVAFPDGADAMRRSIVAGQTGVAYGRFAPEKALPPPPASDPAFHQIYWRYARGEARAASGDADGVLEESRRIEAIAVPDGGGLIELRLVAAKVLAGRAAMLKGDPAGAAKVYAAAAAVQEKAFADFADPPPWWYPLRRSVAAAKMKAGEYRAAAAEARASLRLGRPTAWRFACSATPSGDWGIDAPPTGTGRKPAAPGGVTLTL